MPTKANQQKQPAKATKPIRGEKELPEQMTPFARLLTQFMWSHRPPLTIGGVSVRTGIHRATIDHWIYRGSVPEIDTAVAVMAALHIPIQALLDEYAKDGLPIPPVSQVSQVSQVKQQHDQPASTYAPIAPVAPEPRPYIAPPANSPADERDLLISQATLAMRENGLPESAIRQFADTFRAHLTERANQEQPLQRHISAEHTPPASVIITEPTEPQEQQEQQEEPRSKSPSRPRR